MKKNGFKRVDYNVSNAGSFDGYRFSAWAKGLTKLKKWFGSMKNNLKSLLVAAVGILMFYFTPWATGLWGQGVAAALSAALTKFIVDSLDFFFSDVVIE